VEFVGPAEGMLACGYEGAGRLEDLQKIVACVVEMIPM
jgi:phosphopantothenoylcysteine synthetase/decarboxylase